MVKYTMRVFGFGEDNSVSDLTPDGGLAKSKQAAIRQPTLRDMPILSEREAKMTRDWAIDCPDHVNGARLTRIVDRLTFRG